MRQDTYYELPPWIAFVLTLIAVVVVNLCTPYVLDVWHNTILYILVWFFITNAFFEVGE